MSDIESVIARRVKNTGRWEAVGFCLFILMATGFPLLWAAAVGAGILFHWLHVMELWQADCVGAFLCVALTRGYLPFGLAKTIWSYHLRSMENYEASLWRAARMLPHYYQ